MPVILFTYPHKRMTDGRLDEITIGLLHDTARPNSVNKPACIKKCVYNGAVFWMK